MTGQLPERRMTDQYGDDVGLLQRGFERQQLDCFMQPGHFSLQRRVNSQDRPDAVRRQLIGDVKRRAFAQIAHIGFVG